METKKKPRSLLGLIQDNGMAEYKRIYMRVYRIKNGDKKTLSDEEKTLKTKLDAFDEAERELLLAIRRIFM